MDEGKPPVEILVSSSVFKLNTLTHTDSWVSDVFVWVLVVEGFARLTVAAHGVVQAVVTDASANVPRGQIHRHVEVALGRVAITDAFWEKSKITNINTH